MPVTRPAILALMLLSIELSASDATAQTMIQTTVPLQSNSDSFFESSNVGWSVRGRNFFASFNAPAPPPFGGFNPNAGLTSGFAFRRGGFSGNLNFNFSQGYSRTSTTVAPTVMSLNGYPSNFFAGTVRPFVASVVPTIGRGRGAGGPFFSVPSGNILRGQGPAYRLSQLQERLAQGRKTEPSSRTDRTEPAPEPAPRRELDTAERAAAAFGFFQGSGSRPSSESSSRSTARTTRQSASPPSVSGEPKSLADLYFRKGLEAEARSRTTARMYYRMAFQRATGDLRLQIDRRLQAIGR
jgi:hypothetical protein